MDRNGTIRRNKAWGAGIAAGTSASKRLLITIVAVATLTTPAIADYQSLQVELHTQVSLGGQGYSVYRVYAVFSDPGDYLSAIFGSPTFGNMRIQSRNAEDTGAGSVFFNPVGGGITAPTQSAITLNPDVAFDTFGTINVSVADQAPPPGDQTLPSAGGFQGLGSVTELNTNNASWFVINPIEQGRAGFAGDGDLQLRVLCLQLTVNSGGNVRGTIGISGLKNNPLAGNTTFIIGDQTFNSLPSPGVIAMLALAGAVRLRRWRPDATN